MALSRHIQKLNIHVDRSSETHLDSGASSVVHRLRLPDGRLAAAKTLHLFLNQELFQVFPGTEIWEQFVSNFTAQANILHKAKHRNIVSIIGFVQPEEQHLPRWIVTEMADTTLAAHISNAQGGLPLAQVRSIGIDVLLGISHLHLLGLIHRDIKPKKILLFPGLLAKLGGFSSSRRATQEQQFMTVFGSPAYLAPEVITGRYGQQADMYSFGVMFVEMLTGQLDLHLAPNDRRDTIRMRLTEMAFWPDLVEMVVRAVEPDPFSRCTPEQFLQCLLSFDREYTTSLPRANKAAVTAVAKEPAASSSSDKTRFINYLDQLPKLDIEVSMTKESAVGAGAFGCVFRVMMPDGKWAAAKASHDLLNPQTRQLFPGTPEYDAKVRLVVHEVSLLYTCRHPKIVSLLGFVPKRETLHDGTPVPEWIITELADKSLRDLLSQSHDGCLPLEQCLSIGFDILEGLTFVHQRGFLHRDIKPGNVLVFSNGVAKLSDFGGARSALLDGTISKEGTPLYLAPEVLTGHYRQPADVYSFGITFIQMLTGEALSMTLSPIDKQRRAEELLTIFPVLPIELNQLIVRALDPIAERRCTAEELLHSVGKARSSTAASSTPV